MKALNMPVWAIEGGRMTVQSPLAPALSVAGIGGSVVVGDRRVALGDAAACRVSDRTAADGARTLAAAFVFEEPELQWTWTLSERDGVLRITAALRNMGRVPVMLGAWNVLHLQAGDGGRVELGRTPEHVRFFGWRDWDMRVERFAQEEREHRSSNVCHLFDPDSETVLLCGFVTLDRMLVEHSMQYVPSSGVTEYRATCNPGGHQLPPGAELTSETLEIAYHKDPYAALEWWADRVNRIYRPSFDDEAVVNWCAGAWLQCSDENAETWDRAALQGLEAIRESLDGFGIDFLGGTTHKMYEDGVPGHWLKVNRRQFPGGFERFISAVKDLGFKQKFWFSPFWFFGEAEEALEANRDNLLKDGGGNVITEPGRWEWDAENPADELHWTKYYLDGTHPKTKAYIRKVFKAYREMGVRAYMLDFLAIKDHAKLYDDALLPVEAARDIIKVIREAAGDDTHLQTAVSSTPGFIGLINAARVVRDFGEGRPMEPYPGWKNATYAIHDEHFGNAFSFVQNAAANWFTHRRIYLNDLNALTLDTPVPLEIARISTTMFGLSGGSPLSLCDDVRHMDPERLRMLKMCLPRTQDVPVPVDLFESVYPDDYCRILKLVVNVDWDEYMLVAVFNFDDGGYDTALDFEKLGLETDAAWRVFDFWNREYVGTFRANCPVCVPPMACRLYRLTKARPHPWLLGTDMHVQQGAVEIEALAWDEQAQVLRGTAVRPAGERGNLFFDLAYPLKLTNHAGTCQMKDVRDNRVVVRWPLTFEHERVDFELRFERMTTRFENRRGWLPYATHEEFLAYFEQNRKPGDTRVLE